MAKTLDPMDLKQIIRLHLDGLSNREIEKTLSIGRNTINGYMQRCHVLKNDYIWSALPTLDNMFHTIDIDRNKLTIMGVQFADLKTLESTANAIGSNMFEGFIPTPKGIEIIRDYVIGKITLTELIKFAEEKAYV